MKVLLKKLLSFFGFLLIFATVSAQAQIVNFPLNDSVDGSRVTEQFSILTIETVEEANNIWRLVNEEDLKGNLPYGFTDKFHWAGISVENSVLNSSWMLEINNPHINEVHFYKRVHGDPEWIKLDETGRATPFSTRRVAHFNIVLPFELEQGESADLLVMLDKRRSSINYQFKFWNSNHFNQVQQVHYASFGIYFGMFLLVIIGTIIAYFLSFKKVYLWYSLYVLSVGLFVFNDTGLAQQYIYSDAAHIGGFARILLTYVMLFMFILFTQHYFSIKRNYPKVDFTFTILKGFIALHAGIYYLFSDWFRAHATPMIILLYAIILFSIGMAIYTSYLHLKKERTVSILFLTAFSFIFLAGFVFISIEFGVLPNLDTLFTPIQIGSALEIIFLSVGLAWRVREVENEQISLRDRINRLQNEKLTAYIDGSEKERNRVAMDLHDSIGNRLGNLKRVIESGKTDDDKLEEELKEIMNDVRLISHKLAPPSMGLTGIEQSLAQLVNETDKKSSISYSFQSMEIPNDISEEMKIQIYRIVQEAIQNIEKHSHALSADVQLIGHGNELVLTIEDDGVGMDTEQSLSDGIGIKNIKKRVEYFSGLFELTSQKNRGLLLFISLPLNSQ